MYKTFFGMRTNPFNVNPDPRFLYATKHLKEALACLTYGINGRKGFVLLTGEVGTGKTTLLNALLSLLKKGRVATAFLFNPLLTVNEFFEYILADFGIPNEGSDKGRALLKLNHWLLERYRVGEKVVLIIDEAQDLSAELLEEIRLLTNLETSTEKLLQIILSGQPELEEKLKHPELRQLRQRITIRTRTYPLVYEETSAYIAQRLAIAGANGTAIFSPEAIEGVHKYSRGIPRVINLICEHSLISAFVEQERPISLKTIETVAREFELDEVSPIAPPRPSLGDNRRLVDALKVLWSFQEQLRHVEPIRELFKTEQERK